MPDGTEAFPAGTQRNPDGTTFLKDGTAVWPDGTRVNPDGKIYFPDGSVFQPDGTLILPDGNKIGPNGEVFSLPNKQLKADTKAIQKNLLLSSVSFNKNTQELVAYSKLHPIQASTYTLENGQLSVPSFWLAQTQNTDVNTYLATATRASGTRNYWKNSFAPKGSAYIDFFIFFVEPLRTPVIPYPTLSGIGFLTVLTDGTRVFVRPSSASAPNAPTVDILLRSSSSPYKVRYLPLGERLP